jgi:hypothetical protein
MLSFGFLTRSHEVLSVIHFNLVFTAEKMF